MTREGPTRYKARKEKKYCLNCGKEYMGIVGKGDSHSGLCSYCGRRAGGMDMTETHNEIEVE